MSTRKLALANLKCHMGRTVGLTVLVALLAFVALAGSLVMSSLQNGIGSLEARLGADVIVAPATAKSQQDLNDILIDGVPGQFYMDASVLDEVAGIDGVEVASPQYYLSTMKAGCCSMPVQIIGFDPATDFTVQPWIERTYGGDLGLDQVVVGCNITGAPGATIKLYGVECGIVSKLEKTGTKLDNAVFATNETVRHLINEAVERGFPPDSHEDPAMRISTVQVKVADGYDPEVVAGEITLRVRGAYAVATRAMTSSVAESVSGIAGVIGVLMGVIWVLAAAVLVVVFSIAGKHRAKEFAVLRVIGASRKDLSGVVVKEAVLISALGAVAGIVAALVVVLAFNGALEAALGVPFLTPDIGTMALFAVGAFAVAMVAGPAASAVSARRLSKVDAGQVLREE